MIRLAALGGIFSQIISKMYVSTHVMKLHIYVFQNMLIFVCVVTMQKKHNGNMKYVLC